MSEHEKEFVEIIEQEQEKPVQNLSWWERIKYLITEPSKTMAYLAEKPKVLFPLLSVIFGFILLILPRLDILKEFTREKTLEQLALQGANMTELPDGVLNIAVMSAMVGVVVAPFLVVIVKSIVVHFLARMSGGTGKFKGALSVVAYAYLVNLLGEAVRTIITLITGNFLVYTSLAVVLPDSQLGTPLFTLLSSLDVFAIWYLVLATIGLAFSHQISTKKSGIIVFGSWAAMIAISMASTLIK